MRFEELGSNVLVFVGDDYESVATAFVNGDDVLLVDSLGSMEDASWLRRVLCEDMGKTVRVIAATHFMSDHIAGISRNLEVIVTQSIFTLDTAITSRVRRA